MFHGLKGYTKVEFSDLVLTFDLAVFCIRMCLPRHCQCTKLTAYTDILIGLV